MAIGGGGSSCSSATPQDVLGAVLHVHAEIPAGSRTAKLLGGERDGSGVLINSGGLVLTIGYLVLEASAVDLVDKAGNHIPAQVVGYDNETGLGLLRASQPVPDKPAALGDSDAVKLGDPLLVVANDGKLEGTQAKLVDRREFAGYWEYLLENALFTTPNFADFGGAALLDTQGRLVGIGSLQVGDASGARIPSPGNMFVPVDVLKPMLGDLLTDGHRTGPSRPWLGIYAREIGGHVLVADVAEDGPAAKAGVEAGDLIVGVGATPIHGLADFYPPGVGHGSRRAVGTVDGVQAGRCHRDLARSVDRPLALAQARQQLVGGNPLPSKDRMRLHLATLVCSTVMIAAAARADEVGSWSNDWTGNGLVVEAIPDPKISASPVTSCASIAACSTACPRATGSRTRPMPNLVQADGRCRHRRYRARHQGRGCVQRAHQPRVQVAAGASNLGREEPDADLRHLQPADPGRLGQGRHQHGAAARPASHLEEVSRKLGQNHPLL